MADSKKQDSKFSVFDNMRKAGLQSARRAATNFPVIRELEAIEYHRNGSGPCESFRVVLFTHKGDSGKVEPMMGIVFDAKGHVAILNRQKVEPGKVGMMEGGAFRGDYFEDALRAVIKAQSDGEDAYLAQSAADREQEKGGKAKS